MPNSFENHYKQYRNLRRDFMMATIEQGQGVLQQLSVTDVGLARNILTALRNPGRAAFWIMSDIDPVTRMTPVHQLANGQKDKVRTRLEGYRFAIQPLLRT